MKYVMFGYTEQSVGFGFFLNSNLSAMAARYPERLACELLLRKRSQRFIHRQDSYLDCAQLYRFTRQDLTRRLEPVTHNDALMILAAIECCTLLTPMEKSEIRVSALGVGYIE